MIRKWRENMRKLILSSVLIMVTAMFPFVTNAEAAQKPVTSQVSKTAATINANHVNIRKGAGTTYSTITKLSKGKKIEIIKSSKNKKKETWYNIKFSGKTGWVISKYVNRTVISAKKPQKKTGPVTLAVTKIVGTKSANLYAGAGFDYQITEKLVANTNVTWISEITDPITNQVWENIKTASGNTGWTPKYELVNSKSELTFVYAQKNSQVFQDASNDNPAIASLAENEQINVLNEVNGWLYIETSKGIRGWAAKSQTSGILFRRLIGPQVVNSDDNSSVNWSKPSNFKFKYSTNGSNQLLLTQGFTNVELPSVEINGIRDITTKQVNQNEQSVLITFEPGYTFTIRNYSNKVSIKVMPTGLLGKKIIIDAGHGGKDTGAIGPTKFKEKDANLATALLVKAELEKAGAIVTLTRDTDIFLELSERTTIANSSDYDAFISIHSDSFSSTSKGTTTYYNTSVNFNGPKSKQLAGFVQKDLIGAVNTVSRGTKEQDFYVNRMNELPSILVELAYISNPKEEALLKSTSFQKNAAVGIRKGLEDYFSNL